MKKLLVFVILFSMLFSVAGVLGVPTTTSLNATVSDPIITAIVTNLVDFGNVVSGGSYTRTNNISITPDSSQTSIQVSISNVAGMLFETNLKMDGVAPLSHPLWKFICTSNIEGVCTWDTSITYATPSLAVPAGYPAGPAIGTITYLVQKAV